MTATDATLNTSPAIAAFDDEAPTIELSPLRFATDCKERSFALVEPGMRTQASRPAPPQALETGATLRRRYVLERVIGCGGDSMVFRAKDLRRASAEEESAGYIALKVLLPERQVDALALRRLKREFLLMQSLTHPRIARVFDLDFDGDSWFMSMELITGQSVKAWAREDKPLWQRLKVLAACCEALEYAHSMGVIHGDLKPSNVLVTADDDVKLIDFGASPRRESIETKADPSITATVSFASPQVLSGATVELRDDLFSLACIGYEILSAGLHPFGGKSSLQASREAMAPALISNIPAPLFEVVARALSLEREQRPGSVREFLSELMSYGATPCLGSSKDRPSTPVRAQALPSSSSHASGAGAALRGKLERLRHGVDIGVRKVFDAYPMAVRGIAFSATLARLRLPYGRPTRRKVLMCAALAIIGMAVLSRQTVHEDPIATHKSPQPIARSRHSIVSAPVKAPVLATWVQFDPPVIPNLEPQSHASGKVAFGSSAISVGAGQSLVAIPVTRSQSTRGLGAVTWAIEAGTARPGVDYQEVPSKVIKFFEGQKVRILFIPLLKRDTATVAPGPRTFTVELRKTSDGPALGPLNRVTVTILQ